MAKKPLPGKAKQRPQPRPQDKPKPKAASVRGEKQESSGWLTFAIVAMVITALCYLPSLSNGLVNWDDDPNITENPNLQRINEDGLAKAIPNIFSLDKGAVIGNYNPLPILTFAVEKKLAGGFGEKHTKLIHITNLLLHVLTVFFAMKLLLGMGMGNWGSFVGGLLFGIHPMRVESVAWATERKDVLFAVFFFAALVYYVKWLKQEERGENRTGTYIMMLVLATLSCFSKVQAVTLPLSMLVLDYWYRRPINFKLIWEKTPFWALSLVFGIINLYTLKQQGSTTDDVTEFNLLQRLCIGAYSFVGGMSGVAADLIPFGMALGNRANLNGLNIVGLKRKGFSREQIHELRKAYRMLFSSEGTLKERLEDVEAMFSANELARQIIDFIKSDSDRSFCVPNNVATPSR